MKKEEYKLIPMSEITDEARDIAVAWMECDDKDWIGQKHKLASDIMNYAKKYNTGLLRQRDELREALQSLMGGVRGLPPLTAIAGTLEKQYKQAEAAIKNTETK